MNSFSLPWVIRNRSHLIAVAYLAIFAIAYELALQLRFGFDVPAEMRTLFWHTLPWIAGVKLVVFYTFGSFHGWWRFVTFADLASLLRAATLSVLVIAGIDYFLIPIYQVPRATLAIDWGVTVLLSGGLRCSWRFLREQNWPWDASDARKRALMIGADHGGDALLQQIHRNPQLGYRVVGFLDENHFHHGSRLGGIPFLGSPDEAVQIAEKYSLNDVLVISNSLSGPRLRKLMEACRAANIELKMIPSIDRLLSGDYESQIRDVNINDLLHRAPVSLDAERIASFIAGRRVLVTGAGGSIGSEICRQVSQLGPESVVLVERAENSLFHIEQELRRMSRKVPVAACLADICDARRLESIYERYQPQIVFHAAAHKHVPLMESNCGEAVKNNIGGTRVLADLSHRRGVSHFIMISTDKAVNPTSMMGVTKQIAERYVHALATQSPTQFITVRFGNVLASAGSVVPIFQEQIRRGGPITVTHPEITRFFMTIPEACQLVLQAATAGQGGKIFVLDMGEPVRIVDLAKDLIRLSGLPTGSIEIKFTGLRPGEKLYEELYREQEVDAPTPHPKLRAISPQVADRTELNRQITALMQLADGPVEILRLKLASLAPDYLETATATSQEAASDKSPAASDRRQAASGKSQATSTRLPAAGDDLHTPELNQANEEEETLST